MLTRSDVYALSLGFSEALVLTCLAVVLSTAGIMVLDRYIPPIARILQLQMLCLSHLFKPVLLPNPSFCKDLHLLHLHRPFPNPLTSLPILPPYPPCPTERPHYPPYLPNDQTFRNLFPIISPSSSKQMDEANLQYRSSYYHNSSSHHDDHPPPIHGQRARFRIRSGRAV